MADAPPDQAPARPRVRLGELLVQTGALSADRLAEALKLQQEEGGKRRLGELLVERGFIDENQLTQLLGKQLAVPWVSLYHVDFSRQLLNLVPREVAEAFAIIPIYVRHVRNQGETLYVATADPTNDEGLKRVGAFAGLPVRAMIASASDIRSAIRVYYGGGANPPSTSAPPAAEAIAEQLAVALPPPTVKAPEARRESQVRISIEAPAPEPPRKEPIVVAPPAPEVDAADDTPEIEARPIEIPKKRKTIALTFLDGTTIRLPAPRRAPKSKEEEPPESVAAPAPESEEEGLTARDLVSALRAVSHGADASEILGDNPRWEALFSALLSLLLKKHIIADWEFVEEFKRI